LNDNYNMLRLARRLGFSITRTSDEESHIELTL
jgi:hypothetical protein